MSTHFRHHLIVLILCSVLTFGVFSCAKSEDSETSTTDASGDTGTTTTTTTTTDTATGIIYKAITVNKKQSNLNFDNAQFGNVKFQ